MIFLLVLYEVIIITIFFIFSMVNVLWPNLIKKGFKIKFIGSTDNMKLFIS